MKVPDKEQIPTTPIGFAGPAYIAPLQIFERCGVSAMVLPKSILNYYSYIFHKKPKGKV